MNPIDWMKDEKCEYLPPFLRDFHDAKEFFKTLDAYFKPSVELKAHTWVSNHIFTVDFFLWFCGIHGYTLQKSRKKGVEFESLEATLSAARAERSKALAGIFKSAILDSPASADQGGAGE